MLSPRVCGRRARTAGWRTVAKSCVMAPAYHCGTHNDLLEATERRLGEGWTPQRTLYLAFGHDEEVSGARGAVQISKLLASRGVRLEFVLDEGLVITDGIVPGLSAPAALIGLSEKGYLSLELVANTDGGHSSMPPRETAVGVLAMALSRLQAEPFPESLDGPVGGMFRALGPEMSFTNRLAFANLWLLKGAVVGSCPRSPPPTRRCAPPPPRPC